VDRNLQSIYRLLIGYWILATAWIFIWAFFYVKSIPDIVNFSLVTGKASLEHRSRHWRELARGLSAAFA
jgi:hypothetical protein